jgi:hypothetical protein
VSWGAEKGCSGTEALVTWVGKLFGGSTFLAWNLLEPGWRIKYDFATLQTTPSGGAMSKRPFLLAFAVALGALPLSLVANHDWNGYHWERQQNPLAVQLGDNLAGGWESYLAETASGSTWSAREIADVLSTAVVPGATNPKNCKPVSGRVEVCNSNYGYNGWLGVAQIWVSGKHIVQGSVKLNDSYFSSAYYNTSAWKNFVMCQEVGHTLGLDHQDEDFENANLDSCMDYTNDPTTNQFPNQHDYEELNLIYAHLDGASTSGGGRGNSGKGNSGKGNLPPAMNDIELTGPAQWGRLISGSRQRGTSSYVLDFGSGNRIYTFVVWVR